MTKVPQLPFLEQIQEQSISYNELKGSEHKKNLGQFFTDINIAKFMASLANVNIEQHKINILDCGSGNGILSISLLQRLDTLNLSLNVKLHLYEIDQDIIDSLKSNVEMLQSHLKNVDLSFAIHQENFILKDINEKFDFIISNPPYFKLNKASDEAVKMNYVVYGQPNIYMLFMAKSIELLKDTGEMIFITPRSFTSGSYFKAFRCFFLNNAHFEQIHIFNTRTKHFKSESILQETIITKIVKRQIDRVIISSSEDSSFNDYNEMKVENRLIIDAHEPECVIKLPLDQYDVNILKTFHRSTQTLQSLGYMVSTGKVVTFRSKELIANEHTKNNVPLIWMNNFKNKQLEHPLDFGKEQYISTDNQSLLIDKSNYIIIKRFSSKEQKKRINIGYIFKDKIEYAQIGLENHLNYLYRKDDEMSKKELMILGDFLDSELTDKYFRISNGNTQVNATELMNLPIPDDIYKELISARKHKTENKRYTRTTEKIQYTRALCN